MDIHIESILNIRVFYRLLVKEKKRSSYREYNCFRSYNKVYKMVKFKSWLFQNIKMQQLQIRNFYHEAALTFYFLYNHMPNKQLKLNQL